MDVPRIPGYDVLGRIGAGSSATVWRARRVADDRDVALKVVSVRPEEVSAALREAGVLARVRHEHVIHLYDVLPVPGEGGRPGGVALATELAAGGSLAEVLGARQHLTPGELVTICSPLAGALAELHRAGVLHGDVSPGNVLFRADGMPLLADLGVSRIAGEVRTETYGTDGMIAPEVLEGFPPSAGSDVYALGALAWLCLVGEAPGWVGTRTGLGELRPELPEALVDLVTSCLAAEPADRPDAEELAVALLAAARPEPVELAPGADPAAGLTQRIRASERADSGRSDSGGVDVEHGGEREGEHGGGGRGGDGYLGGVRARGIHPRALHRADDETPRRPRARWVVAGVAAVTVLVLAVAGAVVALRGPGDPTADAAGGSAVTQIGAVVEAVSVAAPEPTEQEPTEPEPTEPEPTEPEPTEPEPADPLPTETQPADGAEPTGVRSTDAETTEGEFTDGEPALDPVAEPVSSAQQLLDARAEAWQSGDVADLGAALVPGSPAHEQEQDSLAGARELEVAYQDLRFTVASASVLASGEERAVLDVEVQRSGYAEVGPGGTLQHPARTDTVELELRLTDGGWRIWGWG